jgi:chaperonin GroEL
LPAETDSPTYILPESIPDHPEVPLDDASRADLRVRLNQATALEGGWTRDRFITDPTSRWAVVTTPVVLVTPAVHAFRELWPAIAVARQQETGLVVVATAFDTASLDTLVVNATTGRLHCVAVRAPSDNALAVVAMATDATVVDRTSLQSGYLPPVNLGHCVVWISNPTHSWALTSP